MSIITISRTVGSHGSLIAEKVAERLGFELVDKKLLEQICRATGTNIDEVEQHDERVQSRTIKLVKSVFEPKVTKIVKEKSPHLKPEDFIETCKKIIISLADQGNHSRERLSRPNRNSRIPIHLIRYFLRERRFHKILHH